MEKEFAEEEINVWYQSPQVEIIEVEVEKGFASSFKDGTEGYTDSNVEIEF